MDKNRKSKQCVVKSQTKSSVSAKEDIFDDLFEEESRTKLESSLYNPTILTKRIKLGLKVFAVFIISFSITFYNYAALPVADSTTHVLLKTNAQIQKVMEQITRNNWIEALRKYQTMIKKQIQQIRELQSIYEETKSYAIYMKRQIGEWKRIGLMLKFNNKDVLREIEEYSDRVIRIASGEPVQAILADTGAIADRMEKNAAKIKVILTGKKNSNQTPPTYKDVRILTNQALGTPQLTNSSTMDILAQYSIEDAIVTIRKINQQLSALVEERDKIDKKYKELAAQGQMNEALKAEYDMKIKHLDFQMTILQTRANLMLTELTLISEMGKVRDRRNFEKAKLQERLSQRAIMDLFGPDIFTKQVQ